MSTTRQNKSNSILLAFEQAKLKNVSTPDLLLDMGTYFEGIGDEQLSTVLRLESLDRSKSINKNSTLLDFLRDSMKLRLKLNLIGLFDELAKSKPDTAYAFRISAVALVLKRRLAEEISQED